MDLGVFIPIGNNGWLISTTSPQYKPSFELNLEVCQLAEKYGFEFALSMIKFRGFGGDSEFWDYNLESFTLMSAIAARTERIKLFASTAVLTLPPAVVARMATTVDSVAPGRFGINIVSGWAPGEYSQMGLWPGDEYFAQRYDYSTEYVTIMQELWANGTVTMDGEFFQMDDCHMKPIPSNKIEIVCAGQSERGMAFCAEFGDYQFILGTGVNTPTAYAPGNVQLLAAAEKTGRDIGSYVLFMVITGDTDEEAMAKWKLYNDGVDTKALAWMADQADSDATADASGTAKTISLPEGAINFNMGTLVGSYESVARMLDEAGSVPGTKGIMLTFDDFIDGLKIFGEKVQPLMKTRSVTVAG
ncbi:MAG: pyrimidine utilization protein A [Actinomycetes bacterium]|nr:pyrimidine utilization protein A [Candidatus Nanopelagicales bacterium]MDP4888651.1 pyrimidine utilization protein A [Candidatus Nanopelagicales bacterium]